MSHDARIVAQFTKMAEAFASSPPIVDREALDVLLEETGASGSDDSLDVACGAGVVACHFAERFNELEKLNDPTHFRALPLSEHLALFHRAGMSEPKVARYKLDFTLSRMQKALGYPVEAARATEERVRASIREDMLDTGSRIEGDETIFSYPIAVLTSRKQVAC